VFIKLTRLDNRPIWLNASFIVTVEPRKGGAGSVVVPIGDGLDYDVRESVEEVLAKLDGAPEAAVVPVPVSDCLTKTPVDVSPNPVHVRDPRSEEMPATAEKPVSAEEPLTAEKPAAAEAPVGEKPTEEKKARKRTVRKAKAVRKADEASPAEKPAEEKKPLPPLELPPDQVIRLVKLAPKTVAKLKNTLATQFHIADVGGTVLALEAKGVFALDGSRVVWPVPPAADAPRL